VKKEVIRVALVTGAFPPKGGGIASAHYQLANLLKRAYDVRVFAYADPERRTEGHIVRRNTPPWIGSQFQIFGRWYVRRYNPSGRAFVVPSILGLSLGAWQLNRSLRQSRPDVLIVPDNNVPLYWLRPPDGCKTIWFSHHNYLRFRDNPLLGEYDWADIDIARSMERRALRKAQAAICPCDYMIGEFRKAYDANIPVFKIPNWFDVEAARAIAPSAFREQKGWNVDLPVVYIPSAGSEIKGKRYVFEIIRRLSKSTDDRARFFLSGFIPPDLTLELGTAGLLEKVHAPGALTWSENLACVKACDLGVSPTLADNFSMAIVEAMALGLPFAAFDTGGNREIISDGRSGWIVPYLDVEALAEQANVLMHDAAKRLNMAAYAANSITQMLAPETVLKAYEMLFQTLGFPATLKDTLHDE
jgi:glycosyltransferase involved in cell wall biosynthesis